MKIGILTYHCVTNFGAQLQCLSTIGYLKKHGHDPIVLNWYPDDLKDFYKRQHPQVQYDEQFNFSQEQMPVSRLCSTLDQLNTEIDSLQLDAILLGSDALFDYAPLKTRRPFSFKKLRFVQTNVDCNHDIPNPFWGSFNDGIKRKIPFGGYAISSQNAPYKKVVAEERKELGRLLNNFTLITTRDEWTKNMVEYLSGRNDVLLVPDPVFAFNNNTDFDISKESLLKKYNLPENYVLFSFHHKYLSEVFINQIVHGVEEATGFATVSFPMPRGLKKFDTTHSIELPLPTLDWYYLIKYSQGYIGELMHPIIVSLHNSVPFYCFDQYGTYKTIIPRIWSKYVKESSKIYDILERASLLTNTISYAEICSVTPERVVKAFLDFDKDKCSAFAELQYSRYEEGMDKVVSSFK